MSTRHAIHSFAVVGCCAILLLNGCHRQQAAGTVIARVGDNILTLEEVKKNIDTTGASFDSRVHGYVASWVNSQLLFQEALRQGIERSETFQSHLADAERQLAVEQYLQQRVYSDTATITDEELRAYFDKHASEFVVREDMLNMNIIAFTTRERASAFASSVTQGTSWESAIKKNMQDSLTASGVLSFSTHKYYSQRLLYPPELWKVAVTLAVNEVSFPVKTLFGYFVLQPFAVVHQGKLAGFDLAQDEARGRLTIEKRRERYNQLIGTLHKQYNVEVMLPQMSQTDTTQRNAHE